MAIYDIEFAETLVRAAQSIATDGMDSLNAKRAVLYLSLLSIEISLKALLEKADRAISIIKSRSHDLDGLLTDLCFYEVEIEVDGRMCWVEAGAELMAISVSEGELTIGVGTLLSDDVGNKSRYPNEIRYGEEINHYSPLTMLQAATVVCERVRQYCKTIRLQKAS